MNRNKDAIEEAEHDLQIDEVIRLHERGWVIQKIGWGIILAIMVAGLLGVFGGGVVSKRKVESGSVTAEYERFFRYETEMKMVLHSNEHIGSVSLPQQYIKNFRLVRFEPQPENNYSRGDAVVYNFLPENNRIVTIYIIPKTYGTIEGVMRINGANNIQLNHFIFP